MAEVITSNFTNNFSTIEGVFNIASPKRLILFHFRYPKTTLKFCQRDKKLLAHSGKCQQKLLLSKLNYTYRLNPVNVCIVFGNFRQKWNFLVFWKKSQNCTDPKKKLMLGRWCSHKRSIPSPKIQLLSNILRNYSNFFAINQYDCREYRKEFFIYVYIINIYTFEKNPQSLGRYIFVYLRSQPTRTCWKRLLKLVKLHAYKWEDCPWSGDCWLRRRKFFKFKSSCNLAGWEPMSENGSPAQNNTFS